MSRNEWEFYCIAHGIAIGSWCIYTPKIRRYGLIGVRSLLKLDAILYYENEIEALIFTDPTVPFAPIKIWIGIVEQEIVAGAFEW